MRRCLLVLGLLCLALPAAPARAEDLSGRTGLGLELGAMKLTGGENDYSKVDEHATLVFRRGLSAHWSLELAVKYGWVRPGVMPSADEPHPEAGFTAESFAPLYTVLWQPRFGVLYHFAPQHRVSPFLGLAAGVTSWRVKYLYDEDPGLSPGGVTEIGYDEDGEQVKLNGTDPTGTVSGGFDIFLSKSLSFGLGARYHVFPGNKKDNIGLSDNWNFRDLPEAGPAHVDANTSMLEAFAGLTVHFGQNDSDGDGLVNRLDACPNEPEDVDGFEDADGCPDLDNDRDGILDKRDKCPNEPEDKDGFEDADGCPDADNDSDGILDAQDQCPDEAEDKDGFEDADGCPDPDNDGDRILDPVDRCPNEPEVYNGLEDEDGCPDETRVRVEKGKITILEMIFFEFNKDVIKPVSFGILDEVAGTLRANPQIKLVRVEGHTDSVGNDKYNRDLSQRRAMAVMRHLVNAGIEPARLIAQGFGEDRPIDSNETAEGRGRNRRVDFIILEEQ